jgi:fluoride exporter
MAAPFPFLATGLVMVGGALGAALRFHLGRLVFNMGVVGFPLATLLANIVGGLSMGILAGILARSAFSLEPWRLLIGVGLLGGFTTFSAFSLEIFVMLERGEWLIAGGYALLSVIASVLALFVGIALIRMLA